MKRLATLVIAASTVAILLASTAQTKATRPGLPSMDLGPEAQETTLKTDGLMSQRTWSDPAAGCHAAILARKAGGEAVVGKAAAALEESLLKAGLRVSDVEASSHQASFKLSGDGVEGIGRLSFSGNTTRVATLRACYWNEREPDRCQTLCLKAMSQ